MSRIKNSYRRFIYVSFALFLILSAHASVAAQVSQSPLLQKAQPVVQESPSGVYIVIMADDPIIAYEGQVAGLSATKPAPGAKVDPDSAQVRSYESHLQAGQDVALQAVGVDNRAKLHTYTFAFNGFAAKLSPDQAEALAKQPNVTRVIPDQMRYKTTDNSGTFLGLTARGGAYAHGYTGEDVIVGVIDTGIWPEHPSFADDGSYDALPIDSLPCEFGNTDHNPNDVPFTCNNKLLGARQMLNTYRALIGADSDEYNSARDDDGHGTHTASTSAGNSDVRAKIFGVPRGVVSGIAPRARIIAYKGLGKLGGFSSDLAAAIDQAVADGVDVINYSIGSSSASIGADDIAFLFAADAGVFVATSAGNSGPNPGTIGSPAAAPWLTSVGASSQSRAFISDIRLRGPGNPPKHIWGGSVTRDIRNFNLVDAEGIADTTGDTSGKCLNPFPPNTFKARDAVLCNQYDFGVGRTDRVNNVKEAGGGAVIFHNSAAVSMTPTDNHPLPTVHMLNKVGQPLKDYLVAHPGKVKISFTTSRAKYANKDERVVPNVMASFSSRGPDLLSLDIIKPDVTAPGINILAGASPAHNSTAAQGELFQSIMGTSMSSPHVAGALALLKQAHPDWTPAMAKSALMTSAYQEVLKHDYDTPADPFDVGAGHINLGPQSDGPRNRHKSDSPLKGTAFDPGLVYDAGLFEYAAFTCGADLGVFTPGTCDFLESLGIPLDPSDLNLPSIGIAELAGSQTVTRIVTSVTDQTIEYKAHVEAPAGYNVTVSPNKLTLAPGESAAFQVTITNNGGAPIGEWVFGSLVWEGGGCEVYSPIAVRASLFDAPAEVFGSGTEGTTSFDVQFGYSGAYTAAAHGLSAQADTTDTISQDPDQTYPSADDGEGVDRIDFPISGAAFARWELVIPGDDDIDLFLEDSAGNIVASSTNGGTDEVIDLVLPPDDTYTMVVHGWSVPNEPLPYTLSTWVVPTAPGGGSLNIDNAPASATVGSIETIDVSWTGLISGTRYLGAVSHNDAGGIIDLTLVNVDAR